MGWVADEDPCHIGLVGHFGQIVDNTDMHDGNLSFQPVNGGDRMGPQLAPIYDMLPMTYAPARGVEVPPRDYAPWLPLPSEKDLWRQAVRAAAVRNDDRATAAPGKDDDGVPLVQPVSHRFETAMKSFSA